MSQRILPTLGAVALSKGSRKRRELRASLFCQYM